MLVKYSRLLIRYTEISLLFLVFFLFPVISHAQDSDAEKGIMISPPIMELNVERGKTYQKTITINNPTEQIIEFYPNSMNFTTNGETGQPLFYPASDDEKNYSLAKWFSLPYTRMALAPNQELKFNFDINVPDDAEAGGHYGVVFFANQPPQAQVKDSPQVVIGSKIGTLVLVKVAGDIKEESRIENFSTKKIYFSLPVKFDLKIRNSGNVHVKPLGDITIKNWFGEEADKILFNTVDGKILPESSRNFDTTWSPTNNKWKLFGRYTAKIVVTGANNNRPLEAQLVFWLLPWWSIISFGSIIILITTFILIKRKGHYRGRPSMY